MKIAFERKKQLKGDRQPRALCQHLHAGTWLCRIVDKWTQRRALSVAPWRWMRCLPLQRRVGASQRVASHNANRRSPFLPTSLIGDNHFPNCKSKTYKAFRRKCSRIFSGPWSRQQGLKQDAEILTMQVFFN